jgi:3-hydroxybutyryl-CoA dehydrogenase
VYAPAAHRVRPLMSAIVERLGFVGAGTMGAGIAQLGCTAGMRTRIHDPVPEALDRGAQRVRDGLARWIDKGRVGDDALERLEPVRSLDDLAGCELVIEAAPESAELKREVFAELSRICGPEAVLATNTSSIPVTSLASAASRPENVVGMHFFNPPPLMRLLEVIRADQTAERALELAVATGEAMGKRVILAADGPGFLVNRCNRPFGLEALRLLQDQAADVGTIDAIVRSCGFRMAGRLGRKSGRGWYTYPREPADAPAPPSPGGGDGRLVVVAGELTVAQELRALAAQAGFDARGQDEADGEVPWLLVDCGADPGGPPLQGGPLALLCADGSLHALDQGGGAVGVLAVLDALRIELGEERYRAAPLLRRVAGYHGDAD